MSSVHETACRTVVDDLLNSKDGHLLWRTLRETLERMNTGKYGWLCDAIGQKLHPFDIYDAYAFLHVQAAVHSGKVLAAEVLLGQAPAADNEIALNNERLASLWQPFSANFEGGCGDDDGFFEWSTPIKVASIVCPDCPATQLQILELEPSRVPLEVGYTFPSRTVLHLSQYKGLARWPYGKTSIYLLKAALSWPGLDLDLADSTSLESQSRTSKSLSKTSSKTVAHTRPKATGKT